MESFFHERFCQKSCCSGEIFCFFSIRKNSKNSFSHFRLLHQRKKAKGNLSRMARICTLSFEKTVIGVAVQNWLIPQERCSFWRDLTICFQYKFPFFQLFWDNFSPRKKVFIQMNPMTKSLIATRSLIFFRSTSPAMKSKMKKEQKNKNNARNQWYILLTIRQ